MDQLRQIADQLGLDETFYYLFGLMLLLYVLLSATYLKPFQKLLHDRKEKTDGTKKEAQDLTVQADEKFANYKSRLQEANESARKIFRDSEERAKKEEAKILEKASAVAKEALQGAQKELDMQKNSILEGVAGEIADIADEIAAKTLGRPVKAH